MIGMVDRIVRGQSYGFIRTTEDREVFFHRSDVTHSSFNDLATGDPVTFRLTDDIMSGPRATHVRWDTGSMLRKNRGKA
jgi:cold shock CspA family protein